MSKTESEKTTTDETTPAPNSKGALWILVVMGGLLALIFIGDYLKSRP